MFSTGDLVDLNDALFGWRGQYTVMPKKVVTELIKIKNVRTNSQQFVRPERLRPSRLAPFFIKTLQQ